MLAAGVCRRQGGVPAACLEPLVLGGDLEQRQGLLQRAPDVEGHSLEGEALGLDLGEVEDVGDDAQEVVARRRG